VEPSTWPAMVHVKALVHPCFHGTGAHYINADTTAFQCSSSWADLFKDFPTLKLIIPHGGGAGRSTGAATAASRSTTRRPPLDELMRTTCGSTPAVYHQPGVRSPHQGGAARQHHVRVGDGRRGCAATTAHGKPFEDHQALCRQCAGALGRRQEEIFEDKRVRAYPRLKDTSPSSEGGARVTETRPIKRSIERLPWVSNIGYRNIGYRNIGYRNNRVSKLGYRSIGIYRHPRQGPGRLERLRQELPRHAADRQEPAELASAWTTATAAGDHADGGRASASSAGGRGRRRARRHSGENRGGGTRWRAARARLADGAACEDLIVLNDPPATGWRSSTAPNRERSVQSPAANIFRLSAPAARHGPPW